MEQTKLRRDTRRLKIRDYVRGNRPIGYQQALAEQMQAHAAVASGAESDFLFLLEHTPVITLGRVSKPDHLLASEDFLKRSGVELFPTNRGGDVTYHGPGQLVGYPIIDLKHINKNVHWYLRRLEDMIILSLKSFGLEGVRNPGFTGVWLHTSAGLAKVAAIGIAISKWVTFHGFALNVAPNFEHFSLIVPCGLHGQAVTSLSRVLNRRVSMDETVEAIESAFAEVYEYDAAYINKENK